MKALLVADNDTAIDNISMVLKAAGYDTIVYRWLLKALDNIEEIAPHLIVISTRDYPRHWKTLTQFAESGIGGMIPQVILYTGDDFPADEKKKAEALHVRGIFDSISVEGLDEFRKILAKKNDIYSGNFGDLPESIISAGEENKNTTLNFDTGEGKNVQTEFLFTNPETKCLVTGVVTGNHNNLITFIPDIPFVVNNMRVGMTITDASIKNESSLKSVIGIVKDIMDNTYTLEIRETE